MSRYATRMVVLAMVVAGLSSSSLQAALITGVSSLNTSAVTVSGFSKNDTLGTVSFTATVLKLHVPVVFKLDFASSGLAKTYRMTINVVNGLPGAFPSTENYMNGFDIQSGDKVGGNAPSNVAVTIDNLVAPSSTYFAAEYDSVSQDYTVPDGFRFGGLLGGGPATYVGSTVGNGSFTINTGGSSAAAGRFGYLTFTANPEPATLILGSMLMAPAVWVVRRRRKGAAAGAETTAV